MMQYTDSKKKRNGVKKIEFFSLLAMIIVSFFAGFTTYSNYVMIPIMLLWIPYLMSLFERLKIDEKTFTKVSSAYLLIMFVYRTIGYSTDEVLFVLRDVAWIMSGVMAVYAMRFSSDKQLSTLFVVFTIVLLALLLVLNNKGRSLDMDEAAATANAWIGSMFMLLTGFSLICFIHIRSLLFRVVFVAILFLTLYLNFFILQRGIVVIFTIFEMALIIVMSLKYRVLISFLFVAILFAFFFVYYSGYYVQFLDWMADVVPSDRLAIRFRQISFALQYGDVEAGGGSLNARERLMGISWNTFTSNIGYFIFGAGAQRGNTVIGHHSFFLDILATYGIIGGLLMLVYFIKQYKIIMSKLNKKLEPVLYSQCAVVFLFYIMRNYYGSMANSCINFMLLMYFPLLIEFIQKYKSEKNTIKI